MTLAAPVCPLLTLVSLVLVTPVFGSLCVPAAYPGDPGACGPGTFGFGSCDLHDAQVLVTMVLMDLMTLTPPTHSIQALVTFVALTLVTHATLQPVTLVTLVLLTLVTLVLHGARDPCDPSACDPGDPGTFELGPRTSSNRSQRQRKNMIDPRTR